MDSPFTAEEQAAKMVLDLKVHCQKHRLPILCLVGLVQSNSIVRAWDNGKEGMTREIFIQQCHELLNPTAN
jgi:hypothetical protein